MSRAGEDALIARYFAPLAGEGADGLRDDAATLTPSPGHDLVLTADAIVAGVHYFPDDPPGSVARKALGVNLSDLAAKGATPRGFLLTLALPDDWTEDWLAGFADGLGAASCAFGCPLLGGDTVRAAGPALIGVTAIGELPTGSMLRRKAARAGDLLCVTGTIGDAALGLRCRLTPDAPWVAALAPEERAVLADRYLHPRPRIGLAPHLRRHAGAAMDVSDGLAGDLAKMLSGLGLSVRVCEQDIPVSPAVQRALALDPSLIETVLAGGDDYEVLFCMAPGEVEDFRAAVQQTKDHFSVIGKIERGQNLPVFIDQFGNERIITKSSFEHFI